LSVENFIQGSFFEDIFAAVKKESTDRRSPSPSRPTIGTPARPDPTLPDYKIVRSTRRKKSISALRRNGIIEIHIPARTTKRQEAELIPEMIAMLLTRESRSLRTESELSAKADELLANLLPEFSERPASITWRKMKDRWGSCTTVDRTIRLSDRLATVPAYVLDWVIFHELIHLRIPDHGKAFTALLERFPERDRAQAYLDGYEAGLNDLPAGKSPPSFD
jgi:Protein of unknown function DUF45